MTEADQNEMVRSLALSAERTSATGTPVKKPRIALVQALNGMDEGWTRWVLEQYGFEFTRIAPADLLAGGAREKFDTIIVTDDSAGIFGGAGGRGGRGGGAGAGRGGQPPPNAAAAPAGQPPADPAKPLDDFVKAGGTIVCFDRASVSAIDGLHLAVKNATSGVARTEFFVGGSVLRVTTDPSQRVMSGMPDEAAIFLENGPAFDTQEGFKGVVLAKYQTTGSPLMSGFLQGEKYLLGKAAALDVELGSGHVVLIGFRPQWRGQPFGTFRMIFNAAIFSK
jgi:hypothetical protein